MIDFEKKRLISDLAADIQGSLYLPNPNSLNHPRFETGTKVFTLVNDENNDIIVWSYRNNYASFYNPNAYSWLDVDAEDNIINVLDIVQLVNAILN